MEEAPNPQPPVDPAAQIARLEKLQAEDFARYYKEREAILKQELEAEKNYDILVVSLSTAAIGASFTLLKDMVRADGAPSFLILSWVALVGSLFTALTDRVLSYWLHRKWREQMDVEFDDWKEGIWPRLHHIHGSLPFRKWLLRLKWISFGSMLVGVMLLMAFVLAALSTPTAPPTTPSTPVVVNVYNGAPPTTMPKARTAP